jgi:PhoH-like ATPase
MEELIKGSSVMAKSRIYVLDTNVLIHDAQSILSFEDQIVGIPITALEELDAFKSETNERGYAAREVIRTLDALRAQGSLKEGVELEGGGKVRVLLVPKGALPPALFPNQTADNQILLTALALKKTGHDVRLVTKDLNVRIKADVLGIAAEDYTKDETGDEIYRGWVSIDVPSVQLKKSVPEELGELLQQHPLAPNEFVLMKAQNNPWHYRIFRYLGGDRFRAVEPPELRWPISARNPQQLMTLDLLFDQNVKLVNLIGPAGTGKTFLALMAGLYQTLITDEFRRVLASRPIVPLGPDIGYLPGDIQEKLRSWMQPMYDAVDFLVHTSSVNLHVEVAHHKPQKGWKKHEKKPKYYDHQEQKSNGLMATIDELAAAGKLSLEAITYMRGRSIPYQYILIDEVQNLTPHEVKTLVSRVGEGSKIVLAGDPFQIDSPYLDRYSNGLTTCTNRFRGQPLFGCVFLETTERSELSKLASELL